jgi:hypothetical protein
MTSVSGFYFETVVKRPRENDRDNGLISFLKNFKCLTFDWDTSRRDALAWDEIYLNDRLMLQLQVGVTKEQFKEWLLADSDFTPNFFISSGLSDKELEKLWNIFFDFKKKEYKEYV